MDEFEHSVRELFASGKRPRLSTDQAPRLVKLLASEDIRFRFYVGDLILRQGRGLVDEVICGAETGKEEVRRSCAFLLGKLWRASREDQRPRLLRNLEGCLEDDDPKVRKNAAVSLGAIGEVGAADGLGEALDREPEDWVRPSQILALGAIGGETARSRLESYEPETDAERDALKKALDRTDDVLPPLPVRLRVDERVGLVLRVAVGLEDVAHGELASKGIRSERQTGGLRLETRDLEEALSARCFVEAMVEIGSAKAGEDEARGIAERVTSQVPQFYEGLNRALHYRIEIRGPGIKHRDRRSQIVEFAEAIDRSENFVNSPSRYDLEIRIERIALHRVINTQMTKKMNVVRKNPWISKRGRFSIDIV